MPSNRNEKEQKEVGLNVRIPIQLRRRIKVFCAGTEQTVESFVREAIQEKLAREEDRAVDEDA